MMKILNAYIIWNIIVFLIYGSDKLFAKKGKRRISEAALLWSSAIFGAFGAMFGMLVFNHKTSKTKFRFFVPLFAFANFVVMFLITK